LTAKAGIATAAATAIEAACAATRRGTDTRASAATRTVSGPVHTVAAIASYAASAARTCTTAAVGTGRTSPRASRRSSIAEWSSTAAAACRRRWLNCCLTTARTAAAACTLSSRCTTTSAGLTVSENIGCATATAIDAGSGSSAAITSAEFDIADAVCGAPAKATC
jgi:hypothetical protein